MQTALQQRPSAVVVALPAFGTMAVDIGAAAAVVTADSGAATADGVCRVLFKGRGFQVAEMSGRQCGGVVAVRAASVAMLAMFAGGVAVVLGGAALVTGRALGIDVNGAGCPGRGRLAPMTAGAGTGAAVGAGRAALGIEVGQNADIISSVMAGPAMAGPTTRANRTETEDVVRAMSPFGIGRAAAVRRLTVTGGAAATAAVRSSVGRMTVEAVGRVGAQGDGINDLLPGAVVAGGAGAVRGPFDLSPARHTVAAAAAGPVREIARTQGQGMAVGTAMNGRIGRMAVETVGRVGTRCDGVHNRLPRAVMAGGAGAGPVGGNVVRGAFNLRPGCHDVTAAAGGAV